VGCVLVVDDPKDDRSQVAAVVGGMGHRVLETQDALRALELARSHGPDVVIADPMLPTMNGPDFVRDLRSDRSLGTTPMIFCTASYVEAEIRSLAANYDVSSFLPKPCEPQTIVSVLSEVLGADSESNGRQLHVLNDELMQRVCELEAANVELARVSIDLQRSNDDLQQFAYIASHDLSEPVRAVSGMVQLLARGYEGRLGEDADLYISHAVEASGRMQVLIDDLLEYSQVGRSELRRDAVDCSVLLDDVIETLGEGIEETAADVSVEPLPTVRGDRGQLQRVFQNLISNALKFSNESRPRIDVGAVHDGAGWRFYVTDNGIGIEPRHSRQIFEVFKRLHTRDTYPGSGVGLSICKRIVERHGGRIWVEGTDGGGSNFQFTIPE
jgi:signal transduction histidine kinase